MPTTYEEIEDEIALGGVAPSQPQVATRRQTALNDHLEVRETKNTRKARSAAKGTSVRDKVTGKNDAAAQSERPAARKTKRTQGQTMDTPEISRKKALATDLARLNRKRYPKKVDIKNQDSISKQQGILMKMIDRGASDAVIGKQIDLIEALTDRKAVNASDYQDEIESDEDPLFDSELKAPDRLTSPKSPIVKRSKRNLQEEEFNLRTAFPAAQPRAQLPRNLRQDRGIDIDKIIEASQAVHPSHDPMQTNELDKHQRLINKTNGIKKPFHPPKRSIEARVGLYETPSPPPKATGQTLNQENLRLHNGGDVMSSIEDWQERWTGGDSQEDGHSPATAWNV